MKKSRNKIIFGFTLVELLVVISILGILASIALVSFRSAQLRGRDTKRKNDLKQIASALELFYGDYQIYPNATAGAPAACPYTYPNSWVACTWGTSELRDFSTSLNKIKTTYIKVLPKDPSGFSYYYRVLSVDSSSNQGFQLFAHLENTEDQNCLAGATKEHDCTDPANIPTGVSCGTEKCNFAVTSSNVKPTD